jgi:hypothetical protein
MTGGFVVSSSKKSQLPSAALRMTGIAGLVGARSEVVETWGATESRSEIIVQSGADPLPLIVE